MKSLKTKVILSAVVLIFALVATIGSTFAWFTVSQTVTASSLNLRVTTADSLLIMVADTDAEIDQTAASYASEFSVDPADPLNGKYTTALQTSDFTSALGYELATWRLNPASAVAADYLSVVPGSLHTLGDTSLARPLTGAATFNGAGANAIQLKFWVMSTSTKALTATATEAVTGTSGTASVIDAVEGSVRLAFTTAANTTGVLFGQDIDYGYDYATMQSNPSLIATPAYTDTSFNKITDRPSTTSIPAAYSTNVGTDGVTSIQTLTLNTPYLVFCTIFVEGWDSDAQNFLSDATMSISFSFTIVNP